jgi:ABC-type bacteriocin/lantibiotic exporter with double-glycine peptidase domain
MVLSAFSFEIIEAELREACDCTLFGTDALKAVDAARNLGFKGTGKHTLSLEQLTQTIDSGTYPIVFVSMLPVDGIRETHSLVVIAISQSEIIVYDPAHGERTLSMQTFTVAWECRSNVAIIVDR